MKLIKEYRHNENIVLKKFQMDNGLKVTHLFDPTADVFAYHTWFSVGSRNERDGITGIAHFFEHLMFKETKNHSEGEFDRILEEEGGSINAATYYDWTFYRECMPNKAFHLVPMLEADRMQHMILNEKQLNSEREVVANERRFRIDNSPSGTMHEALYSLAFEEHHYKWPVIGWMKDIESISLDDCLNFYKTYYAPNNANIVVVGGVDESTVLSEIEKNYGMIPSSDIPESVIPEEPQQGEYREKTMDLTISNEKALFGFKAPSQKHPDHAALAVLQAVLLDGKSSRLEKKLISESSVCSEVSGWVDQTMDPGLFHTSMSMKPGQSIETGLKIYHEEIDKLKSDLVSDEELEKVKNIVEYSFWDQFATVDDKAQALGFFETVSGDFERFFGEVGLLQSVTANDVQKAAQKYLNKDQMTCIKAFPQKEKTN